MDNVPTLGLHSVMLGVRDVDESVAFYKDKLGLTLSARFSDFAVLEANGSTIVLSAQLARARQSEAHPSVEVVLAVQGVRASYEALRARGVNFINEPHTIDGINDGVHFEDLDGHLFSLYGSP